MESKRRRDGRWNLDSTNGDLRLEVPHRPSRMITFLALRVLRRGWSAGDFKDPGPRR